MDNCDHTPEYKAEHDNFYCTKCHKGMGNAYCRVAKEAERLRTENERLAIACVEKESALRRIWDEDCEHLDDTINDLRMIACKASGPTAKWMADHLKLAEAVCEQYMAYKKADADATASDTLEASLKAVEEHKKLGAALMDYRANCKRLRK